MKGPYERLKYDLRRVWECPLCGKQTRTPGTVVNALCVCQQPKPMSERVWMKLVHDGALRVGEPTR